MIRYVVIVIAREPSRSAPISDVNRGRSYLEEGQMMKEKNYEA